jgi:uncharacterized membrane protein YeaQ/YmgE (transglycosylase-associated protein family)
MSAGFFCSQFIDHRLSRFARASLRYRFDGFLSKWIVAWIGGWLGSPVLGHWGFQIANVYVIPAVMGAFVGTFLVRASVKAVTVAALTASGKTVAAPAQFEMRKAS